MLTLLKPSDYVKAEPWFKASSGNPGKCVCINLKDLFPKWQKLLTITCSYKISLTLNCAIWTPLIFLVHHFSLVYSYFIKKHFNLFIWLFLNAIRNFVLYHGCDLDGVVFKGSCAYLTRMSIEKCQFFCTFAHIRRVM